MIAYLAKMVGGQGVIVKGVGWTMSWNASSALMTTRVSILGNLPATSSPEAKNILVNIDKATTILSSKDIKTISTEGRNLFSKPGWLPKPGTASPGRWGRQSSSEDLIKIFWMENQNGTNQPCTECSKRWSRARCCPSMCAWLGQQSMKIFPFWYWYFFLISSQYVAIY